MWPWTIKFLWSPFLEIFRTKKFFVVTTQLLSGVLFGLAALALHMPHFFAVTVGSSRWWPSAAPRTTSRPTAFTCRSSRPGIRRGISAGRGVLQPCETSRHGRPGLVRGLAQQAFQRFRGGDLRCLCAVVDGGAGDPLRPARPAGYLPQPRVAVGRKCG